MVHVGVWFALVSCSFRSLPGHMWQHAWRSCLTSIYVRSPTSPVAHGAGYLFYSAKRRCTLSASKTEIACGEVMDILLFLMIWFGSIVVLTFSDGLDAPNEIFLNLPPVDIEESRVSYAQLERSSSSSIWSTAGSKHHRKLTPPINRKRCGRPMPRTPECSSTSRSPTSRERRAD